MQRIVLDTNILAYLAGFERVEADHPKVEQSRRIMADLAGDVTFLAPIQSLGELFVVLSKAAIPADESRAILLEFSQGLETVETSAAVFEAALDLVVDHRLQFWHALILSAAATARATLLLSEDMQDGFVWRGITVVNPFAPQPHRKLATLLHRT